MLYRVQIVLFSLLQTWRHVSDSICTPSVINDRQGVATTRATVCAHVCILMDVGHVGGPAGQTFNAVGQVWKWHGINISSPILWVVCEWGR